MKTNEDRQKKDKRTNAEYTERERFANRSPEECVSLQADSSAMEGLISDAVENGNGEKRRVSKRHKTCLRE